MLALFFTLLGVLWLALAHCFILLKRNTKVKNFLLHLLELIPKEGGIDEYEKRIKILTRPGYNKMVYQFWKPLKLNSFWSVKEVMEMLIPKEERDLIEGNKVL